MCSPGRENVKADALSHNPVPSTGGEGEQELQVAQIQLSGD